jgi:hypothetical protein
MWRLGVILWLVGRCCRNIGVGGRIPDFLDGLNYVVSSDLLWKNFTPLLYAPSSYKSTKTRKQTLDTVNLLRSTASRGFTHWVPYDIGRFALFQCLHQVAHFRSS